MAILKVAVELSNFLARNFLLGSMHLTRRMPARQLRSCTSRPLPLPDGWQRPQTVPLLVLEEVARICRVKTTKTVRRWITEGIGGVRLPASRLGRQWRVHPDDLASFLRKTRI